MTGTKFQLIALLAAAGLFLGLMVCFDIGRRIGLARLARAPDAVGPEAGPVEAAVFGLLGLLLAFTFSGAASRFEARRHLIGNEANAIGTAYLRLDLLPLEVQPEARELFRRYLDTRIATYRGTLDVSAVQARISEAEVLQQQIWGAAVGAFRPPQTPNYAPTLLLGALNDMFDIRTTRVVASQNHPPFVVFIMLAGLSLTSALLVGYVTSQTRFRIWFHMLVMATTMSVTFYVIVDIEYPRLGFIRIDGADQVLVDLRSSMR